MHLEAVVAVMPLVAVVTTTSERRGRRLPTTSANSAASATAASWWPSAEAEIGPADDRREMDRLLA